MRSHSAQLSRIRTSGLVLALAAALLLPAASAFAQDEPVRRTSEQEQRLREIKEAQRELMWQGARRHFARAAEQAKEAKLAAKKARASKKPAAPVKRGTRARPAVADDVTPAESGTRERRAQEAWARATAAIPANVRANNPAGDAATAGQAEEMVISLGDNILVAWNDGQGFNTGGDTQGYAYSTDGGATFTDGGDLPHPAGSPQWEWTSDPVTAVDQKSGKFYYCGLANPDISHNGVGVAIGHFEGASFVWDTVLAIRSVNNATNFLDKEWLVADSSGAGGKVYVTYTNFNTTDWIDYQYSTDGGLTWSTPVQVSSAADNGYVQGSRPVAGPGGEVFVTWSNISRTTNADDFHVRRSADGLPASFGPVVLATKHLENFSTGAPGFNRERGIHFPAIAVDRTTGPYRGRVYLTWNEAYDFMDDPFSPLAGGQVEIEPNGFAAAATLFVPGQTLRGSTSAVSPSDFDWWKCVLTAGQHLIVYADSLPASQTYTLRVLAPGADSLQRLAFGGDITPGTGVSRAFYTYTAPVDGTYYLRYVPAFTSTNSKTGPYRIRTMAGVRLLERGRDQRDIFAAWSDDGTTWSVPALVNDCAVGYDEFLPEVAVGADGLPYVSWRDHRDDAWGSRTHEYVARSLDGGATWSANQRFTSAQGNFTLCASNIAPNEGDYNSAWGDERFVRFAWSDGRGTNVDVWTTELDTWHSVTDCPADQEVTLEQAVNLSWTVNNLNALFGNELAYTVTSERNWPGTSAAGTLNLDALGSGAVNLGFTVPDTAAGGTHVITLAVTNAMGTFTQSCPVTLTVTGQTAVGDGGPVAFALRPAAPNPARGTARIGFALPRAGRVTLRVYGLRGERVRTLVDGERGAGLHDVTWDGLDDHGNAVQAGAYFYRLEGLGQSATRRLVWMK